MGSPTLPGESPWCPPVPLVAGRQPIEVMVLINGGSGHLSLAWKRPDTNRELLTGEYLSPMKSNP
jgi:hypothetical protein